MRRRSALLTLALAAAGMPLASYAVATDVTCGEVAKPTLAFQPPVFVDTARAGGEPVTVVAQDGSISMSAHAGTTHVYKDAGAAGGAGDFAVGYWNQTLNWRSADGGKTWKYVGQAGTGVGPHSLTSTGFSDPDFTVDEGGRIYNTEIDLANVAVFSSNDDGQSYNLANPEVSSGDRPWVTGGKKDEVYLYVNLPRQILRSTDAGKTWTVQATEYTSNGATLPTAKFYIDPRNKATGLIGPRGPRGVNGITISTDQGKTWKTYPGADLGPSVDFFGAIAVDKGGHAYATAAGGYSGPGDTSPNGRVTFNYFDRDEMAWADAPVEVPLAVPGSALWPWIVAGDEDRVAIAWLQNTADKPKEFRMFVGVTANARGTTVTCSDGSERFVEPQFAVADAAGRPIHVGDICLSGTACNTSTGDPGDRRLGDFSTVNFDKDGKLIVATADTTLKSPTGGKKPVGNPLFVASTDDSTRLLTTPMQTRPTRALCVLPTCW